MNFLGIGSVIESVGKVASDLITTDKERMELELEAKRIDQAIDLGQMEVNKVEAAHRSIFVAGWRPFLGWVGGVSLAYVFLVQPMTNWALMVWYPGIVTPTVPTDFLFELVLAMLGMGGLRTFEKMKGVTK